MSTHGEVRAADNLFLSDDDDDQMADAPPRRMPNTPPPRAELQPDVVAAFAAVDSLPDTPGAGDDTRAPALTPHQVLSSSPAHHLDDTGDKGDGKASKDGKKPKKKVLRLDEGRLIECFPQLIEDTKNIKIKGKGHEASDLNRLLQVYQFWTHRLYPKTPFKDTVDRVEKLCHSKRMHNQLSRWRDEARGVADEGAGEDQDRGLVDLTDDSIAAADSDQADYASSSSHEATRPPSSVDGDVRASSVEYDFNDDPDMVAAMDAAGKFNSRQRFKGGPTSSLTAGDEGREANAELEVAKEPRSQLVADDDEELWSMVDKDTMNTAATVPQQHIPEDDDEAWAAMDVMNEEVAAKTVPAMSVPQRALNDDLEEDWDALDAMAVDSR